MELKTLPSTNLEVSVMGLGLAALGRPGYINLNHAADLDYNYEAEEMELRTHEILDEAWAAGIRYFDVARSYGRAEKFLSDWLTGRRINPDEVVVGSKWGYTYTADWKVKAEKHEVKIHSLQQLDQQKEESQLLLGKYLKIYQIHSVTLESGVLENKLVLDRLHAMKLRGLAIGLTLSGERQDGVLEKALEIEYEGELLFNTVQATWNVLEQSAASMLAEARKAGIGVIIKETLANGRLTQKNQEQSFQRKLNVIKEIAEENETTPDAVALAFVLAQPWIDVVLSGAVTLEQLRSNLKAVQVQLSGDQMERLKRLHEEPKEYWEKRSKLEWN